MCIRDRSINVLNLLITERLNPELKEGCKGCPYCNRPARSSEMEEHQTFWCTSKYPISALKHRDEFRAWEKKLHQETSKISNEKLIANKVGVFQGSAPAWLVQNSITINKSGNDAH